ncbi:ferrochelatase [Helicobacter sp. MIT 14-3879]|uniref:ferrochelatase n=1 Tax=Helicobacter sp. MIT 14-3879 TaxID=2040649 RepID=UPI000E1F634F|nr:ferrochelatase [Helicobacter sp. MIT 14-3879]RDU59477.1 ferrochelatase [Helicobacter sp. MIT 14-3879]
MGYNNAVVLLNMGGPNSLQEVAPFLKNIFADPCILSIQNNTFRSLLGNMIVNSRLEKSKKIYAALGGCSPITQITFSLTQKLQARNPSTFYTYAMRYTAPFCYDVLKEICEKGIHDITLFSMYPQYSTTTTFSSFNDAASALKKLEFQPTVRLIERYYDHVLYINSIVNSLQKTLASADSEDFVLILSAHSVPISRIKRGDPYKSECEKSYDCLIESLKQSGMKFQNIILSYQSKVGPVKWLGPNTRDIIRQQAPKNLIIYPLSFSIDNSETRYELSIQYRELADSLGVKDYRVCECLNDSEDFMNLILTLTQH